MQKHTAWPACRVILDHGGDEAHGRCPGGKKHQLVFIPRVAEGLEGDLYICRIPGGKRAFFQDKYDFCLPSALASLQGTMQLFTTCRPLPGEVPKPCSGLMLCFGHLGEGVDNLVSLLYDEYCTQALQSGLFAS